MIRWINRLRSDEARTPALDAIVLVAAGLALIATVAGAMHTGTFSAIADVMSTGESSTGCVQTGESGTTDLSNCQ